MKNSLMTVREYVEIERYHSEEKKSLFGSEKNL